MSCYRQFPPILLCTQQFWSWASSRYMRAQNLRVPAKQVHNKLLAMLKSNQTRNQHIWHIWWCLCSSSDNVACRGRSGKILPNWNAHRKRSRPYKTDVLQIQSRSRYVTYSKLSVVMLWYNLFSVSRHISLPFSPCTCQSLYANFRRSEHWLS